MFPRIIANSPSIGFSIFWPSSANGSHPNTNRWMVPTIHSERVSLQIEKYTPWHPLTAGFRGPPRKLRTRPSSLPSRICGAVGRLFCILSGGFLRGFPWLTRCRPTVPNIRREDAIIIRVIQTALAVADDVKNLATANSRL